MLWVRRGVATANEHVILLHDVTSTQRRDDPLFWLHVT